MGFAVIHIEKGTAGKAGGLGNHIDRSKHVPNADPSLTGHNARAELSDSFPGAVRWTKEKNRESLQTRVNNRIKEGYTGKTAIRKDAVTHLNIVMSGSHHDMIRITKENRLREWADDNYKFACERFGQKNIVEFTMHLDERTLHIHCVAVPLTEEGRLSAKEVMGNREKMTGLQEEYGKAMAKYNLDRGLKGSNATHDSVREFYARINSAMPIHAERYPERIEIPKVSEPPRIVINPEKWSREQTGKIVDSIGEQLRAREATLKQNLDEKLKSVNTERAKKTEEVQRLRKENAQLRGIVKEQDKKLHPEKYVQAQKKEQSQNQNQSRGRGMKR